MNDDRLHFDPAASDGEEIPESALRDHELSDRLRTALSAASPPAQLSARLHALAQTRAAGEPFEPAGAPWGDLIGPMASVLLLVFLVIGSCGPFMATIVRMAAQNGEGFGSMTAKLGFAAPQLLSGAPLLAAATLLVPLGVLLTVEILRGGPTLRRWLR